MSSVTKLSSWLCSVACGVCLALAALTSTAKADPPGLGGEGLICELNCSPPLCGGYLCLCGVVTNTCKTMPGSTTDCECLPF